MLDKEVKELETKIKHLKKDSKKPQKVGNNKMSGLNIALELLSGGIIGTIIGLFVDKQLKSAPLCLIICIIIGFGAGFKNIWIRMNNKNGS